MQDAVAVFQVSFWTIASIIAILTYRQARHGLLQPIRTEIFKIQVEELKRIIGLFSGKGEIELRKESDLDAILRVNIVKMFDDYAFLEFGVKVDREKRPYNITDCPVAMMTMSYAQKNLRLLNDHKENQEKSSRERLSWDEYEFGEISISRKHVNYGETLSVIKSNPILPSEIVLLIEKYEEHLSENLLIIGDVLTDLSRKMRSHYPSIEDLHKSRIYWIESEFVERQPKLQPTTEEIIKKSREYFDPDNIIKNDNKRLTTELKEYIVRNFKTAKRLCTSKFRKTGAES